MLGTYRDTELGRHTPLTAALSELKRNGALDRIDLRGLPVDDVAELARSMLGSDELAPRVHARTDGNVFFVEEVLRELAESGPHVVPESVRHAVGVRLSRMGEDANEMIAAAAILGLEHDARALQATAGLEAGAAEAALDEILRARLLRPASIPQRFEFAHALVREAVLDECNVLRRVRLHRRAADALGELGEEHHLEEIALHFFEAASTVDARHAAEVLVRAGRRALERLAYEDAAECFNRAAQALELGGADEESGPVLLVRGDALLRAGEPEAARTAFTQCRAMALRRGDERLLAETALGFAGLGIAIVDLDAEAIARLEEALERAEDPALRARVQARLAVELYYAPERARSDLHRPMGLPVNSPMASGATAVQPPGPPRTKIAAEATAPGPTSMFLTALACGSRHPPRRAASRAAEHRNQPRSIRCRSTPARRAARVDPSPGAALAGSARSARLGQQRDDAVATRNGTTREKTPGGVLSRNAAPQGATGSPRANERFTPVNSR
ncbi:MAG TPA: hypothetical protein VHW04_07245 [Solirubrobacteraceae bacterium]|nr:hypothetical protein [Solirubrobacteraceae bacterium]